MASKLKLKYLDFDPIDNNKIVTGDESHSVVTVDYDGQVKIDRVTVDSTILTNNGVNLTSAVDSSMMHHTRVVLSGAPKQVYGKDFEILPGDNNKSFLSWENLGLADCNLEVGNILLVEYYFTIGSEILDCETIEITSTHVTNKYVDVQYEILNPYDLFIHINGGPSQFMGDFEVILDDASKLRRISWAGKDIDGIIAPGDLIIINYKRVNF